MKIEKEKRVVANAFETGIITELQTEIAKAQGKHPPYHSPHEALAVIMEEFDELKTEVYAQQYNHEKARKEALQLACTAIRYLIDLDRSEAVFPRAGRPNSGGHEIEELFGLTPSPRPQHFDTVGELAQAVREGRVKPGEVVDLSTPMGLATAVFRDPSTKGGFPGK